MHIEKIRGRKSKAIREMIDEPVIVELISGQFFGGYIDDYETGAFWLYDCKRLSKKDHEWRNHGIMTEVNGKKIEDPMPEFYVDAVRNLFTVKSNYGDEVSVEDALQFYIDPHHKPFVAVRCSHTLGSDGHSLECDARLHDALAFVYMRAQSGSLDHDETIKLREAFFYIRRRLLMYGARIP